MYKKISLIIIILAFISLVCFAQGAKELNQLEAGSQSDNPYELMKTIAITEEIMGSIANKYEKLFISDVAIIESSYKSEFSKIEQLEPEIWETDREFTKRKKEERSNIQTSMETEIAATATLLGIEKDNELAPYKKWRELSLDRLTQEKSTNGGDVQLVPQAYERNDRIWPIIISSTSPIMNFDNFEVFVKFNQKNVNESTSNQLYQDGYYFALSDDFSSSGWLDFVEIEVKNGMIISAIWDAFNEDYELKSELDRAGKYNMVKFGGAVDEWYVQAQRVIEHLITTQDPTDIHYVDSYGHTDAISGATIQVAQFFSLAEEALVSGPIAGDSPRDVNTDPELISYSDTPRFLDSKIHPLVLVALSNDTIEFKQEIIDFDVAVKEGKLIGNIDWSFRQDLPNNRFITKISGVSIINQVNGLTYSAKLPTALITNSYMAQGSNINNAYVEETSTITDIRIENPLVISPNKTITPIVLFEPENTLDKHYSLSIENQDIAQVKDNTIVAGNSLGVTTVLITASNGLYAQSFDVRVEYQVGDIGPAGGIIFYDAGNFIEGWRYLEVAPDDIYNWRKERDVKEIPWRGSNRTYNVPVKTGTHIGSGKHNTQEIADFLSTNDNSAQLCLDYVVNDYDDWFLPSKDELNALITFTVDTYGNYRDLLDGFSYRSSSLSQDSKYWEQTVYNQEQETLEIYHTTSSIRAIRQF